MFLGHVNKLLSKQKNEFSKVSITQKLLRDFFLLKYMTTGVFFIVEKLYTEK